MAPHPNAIVELTGESFADAILAARRPVLVDFWAPWCAPCRAMAPVLETIAEVFGGYLTVAKVNIDHHPDVAAQWQVASVPTLSLFSNGDIVRTWSGAQPQAVLVHELADFIRRTPTPVTA